VVSSPNWNGARGAATWASSITGVRGTVSDTNSLVGASAHDSTGQFIFTLSNGNCVITTPGWNDQRGAVTWASGATGLTGIVSEVNSLVGTHAGDHVGGFIGNGVTALPNGNYLVSSPNWDGNRGAVTWANGMTGISGPVSEANSLVSAHPENGGTFTVLPNSNYVLASPYWNDGRGAVTWGSGTAGVSGVVSEANSLVGTHPNDYVGRVSILLGNSNYVVSSPSWNGGRGAVTWSSGSAGVTGPVSEANSLFGAAPGDSVGSLGIVSLNNGNYVVLSQFWNGNRGAVTWGSGAAATSGIVSEPNSLVGTHPNDLMGYFAVAPLSTGNYLVISPLWNGASGALTLGNGASGTTGPISQANSLVGNPGDQVGFGALTLLHNGNYVFQSQAWGGSRGAVTWGSGTSPLTGLMSSDNSLVGSNAGDLVSLSVTAFNNGNYLVVPVVESGSRSGHVGQRHNGHQRDCFGGKQPHWQ